MAEDLLKVENLQTQFKRVDDTIYAVNGVSFSVAPGETLGIVGESGSGKSVSVLSMLGLIRGGKVVSGTANFMGTDLLKLRRRQLEDMRGRDIGMIFQDPMTSLNPTMRVGDQIMEAMLTHHYASKKRAFARTLELFEEVGIPEGRARFRSYPHEFSGGMRQRAMIAMAVACEPQLLIADEATTAVDVTVQAQILTLLAKLREERKMSIIMITHDFGVATNFCDRIIVLYGGKIMESAALEDFLRRPAHPYTIGLKASVIEVGHRGRTLTPIPGMTPTVTEFPRSCPFVARCPMAIQRCHDELPELRSIGPAGQASSEPGTFAFDSAAPTSGHTVACHRAEEVLARAS